MPDPSPTTPASAPQFPAPPIASNCIYLNHAGVAPLSAPAADALRRYADDMLTRAPYTEVPFHKHVEAARALAARFLRARGPHEVAFVPNTTHGLALVAKGISWRPGDSVVITGVEYPANRYPWEDIARRHNVDLIEVPQLPDGRIDPEDVCDAIRDTTRVVAISHVQYATGHRVDLEPISKTIHQVGGFLCVDAIQSLGVLPVDVQSLGIDFLAADGHKWMLGPEGCGLFYCHEDLAQQLHPNVVGWMNMINATDYGNYQFELLPDARRFEPGSHNIPGVLALAASLDMLLTLGLPEVWRRVEALTSHLCTRLESKGYRVFSPRRLPEERSGIVSFVPSRESLVPSQIVADLAKQKIHIVTRESRLRASPHYHNTLDQMDALVDALP